MSKSILLFAIGSGFVAVLLGAFGAHALKNIVPTAALDTWHTASFYHFVHTLVLFLLVLKHSVSPLKSEQFNFISLAFIVGIVLFSGSLYAYVLSALKPLVFVTPLGGLCLLLAWGGWFYFELKSKG